MSNEKLTALVERTTPALSDLLYDVPSGAPIGNKITLGNLLANAPSVTFANSHTFPGITLSTTPLPPASGGTGIANNAAATMTRSGNFALTLTLTAPTNVTLPTSGTLLTAAGAVTSITGTADQVIASAAVGAVTLSLPQSINTTSSPTFTDLTLSGGDLIASTSTTFNVFNTVATTVNFAGAATTVAMGAGAASSASFNFTTAIALNTASITSNQTTVAVLNVTPTTINAFGAATVINMGAATALTTLLGSLTVTGTTVTASTPVINATQAWNNAGVTFTGMKLNVTDTASAAASLLMQLQVGGNNRVTITKTGAINVNNGVDAAYNITVTNTTAGTGASASLTTINDLTKIMQFGIFSSLTTAAGAIASGSAFCYTTSASGLVLVSGDAAGVIKFATGGTTERWRMTAAGHFIGGADNAYDIGAAGATRPRTAYVATSVITPAINNGATGLTIGSAGTDKLGFFGAAVVIRPTGVAVDAAGIHAALVTLGLITA